MAGLHVMGETTQRPERNDNAGQASEPRDADSQRRAGDTGALCAKAQAERDRSALLARQLQAAEHQAKENWQLIRDAWGRAERLRAQRLAASTDPGRLRYSAYARLQARLTSLPLIEQAKGIIMAQYGWPEDQAFDAMRRMSQQENIKVRELAASIVAQARSAPAQPPTAPVSTTAQPGRRREPVPGPGGSRDRHRESAQSSHEAARPARSR